MRSALPITLVLGLLSLPTLAQVPFSSDEKAAVIENIQLLIASDYVFPDQVDRVNAALDARLVEGRYDDVSTRDAFAEALTEDLVAITTDKHYKVGYRPELVASRRAAEEGRASPEDVAEADQADTIDWNLWYARQENFGFKRIEVLEGNVGYIQLTFFHPFDWMRSTIDAAMTFVADTDALIIDLRANGGGYSPSDTYLGSYFLDPDPVLWSTSYTRPTDERESVYTFGEVGAPRYRNRPVILLVSAETFSLGEKFAYTMKHFDQAEIIGQVTAGAANGISFRLVDDNFVIQIPAQQSVNPVTETNWEGIGVQPDIETAPEEALARAHLLALDQLIATAKYDRAKARYQEIKATIGH
ncbi:MAG: S41 family peptidase [Pseudomonadota bacterium]